jgi:hypothetical protein
MNTVKEKAKEIITRENVKVACGILSSVGICAWGAACLINAVKR